MLKPKQLIDGKWLSKKGLNLQAVVDLSSLPVELSESLKRASARFHRYTQLILIGHAGKSLWRRIDPYRFEQNNPIDQYSFDTVTEYFQERFQMDDFEIVFPGQKSNSANANVCLNFQQLGEIVGWHHQSPLKIGINSNWGTWFAYRALVLVKADYGVSKPTVSKSPCASCKQPPCIQVCPAKALDSGQLELKSCLDYRNSANSKCADRCLSRMACPVQESKKYSLDQIQYHYSQSMSVIRGVLPQ